MPKPISPVRPAWLDDLAEDSTLGVSDVAAMFGIRYSSVQRSVDRGHIPAPDSQSKRAGAPILKWTAGLLRRYFDGKVVLRPAEKPVRVKQKRAQFSQADLEAAMQAFSAH